jgi:hypothetical protein
MDWAEIAERAKGMAWAGAGKALEEERRGAARVLLRPARLVAVEGAVLLGPDGEALAEGVRARLVSERDGLSGRWEPLWPGDEERLVWARPLGPGHRRGGLEVWRRGRLRVEADRVAFTDEPGAGDGRGAGGGRPRRSRATHETAVARRRTLEGDIARAAAVRLKAEHNECYAEMLAIALGAARWRHRDGRTFGGGRSPSSMLVARLVGVAAPRHYARGGPPDALDEEVLADLGALGWEPVAPMRAGIGPV